MWASEIIKYSDHVYKLLIRPELFIPLTWHFHIFQKRSDSEYVTFLFPYDNIENIKVSEALAQFKLTWSKSIDGVKYRLEDLKGKIIYTFQIPPKHASIISIMVGVEKKGLFTQIPVEPQHLLNHIIENVKLIE